MARNKLDYSKGSWHYRVIFFVWMNYHWNRPVPTNLCPYLRKLCISIVALPFFAVWRKLPRSITKHELESQLLFGYGVIVHLIMFFITITSGGEFIDSTENIYIDIFTCSTPYDITTCVILEPTSNGSSMENIQSMEWGESGTMLYATEFVDVTTTVIEIEWWWGWAFYIISVLVLWAGFYLILGVGLLIDKIRDSDRGESLGILGDYMEAKHDKICPCINFKEKEEKKDG